MDRLQQLCRFDGLLLHYDPLIYFQDREYGRSDMR